MPRPHSSVNQEGCVAIAMSLDQGDADGWLRESMLGDGAYARFSPASKRRIQFCRLFSVSM
jgi:hypothetical protein